MPEAIPNHIPHSVAEFSNIEASTANYTAGLHTLSEQVPEIAAKRESLAHAGAEIIGQFDIQPSLFEDEGRTMVFATIADRWAGNKAQHGEVAQKEQDFLLDCLTMLAYKHSPQFAEYKSVIQREETLSDSDKLRVYDRYTDRTLTHELKQAISEGLLDGVKERLGITAENEDPYEVRVLSIDPEGMTSYGLDAGQTAPEDLPEDPKEQVRQIDEDFKTQQAVRAQQRGLKERAQQMARELNEENLFAPAWVSRLEDKTLLCLTMPTTEKILNPELTKTSSYYTERDLVGDIAFLEHEYTHTQGGVNLDKEFAFGINAEELRAEHFSGNRQGYQDIKFLFQDLATITDVGVAHDILSHAPKGGTPATLYERLSNEIGMAATLEILLAAPRNYLQEQSNAFHAEAVKYLGGYDGILGRILENEIASGNAEQVEQRITERTEQYLKISKEYEGLFSYRRISGHNVITDLLEKKAKELQGVSKKD